MVLDDLVLHDAHAGLLDRLLGQRDAGLVRGHGGLEEDLVDLLLVEGGVLCLGDAHLVEGRLQGVDAVDGLDGVEDLVGICHG